MAGSASRGRLRFNASFCLVNMSVVYVLYLYMSVYICMYRHVYICMNMIVSCMSTCAYIMFVCYDYVQHCKNTVSVELPYRYKFDLLILLCIATS